MATNFALFKRDMQEVRYRSKAHQMLAEGRNGKPVVRRGRKARSLGSSFEFIEFVEVIGLQVLNSTDPKNPTNRDGSAIETF
jgi:hypothetical protein